MQLDTRLAALAPGFDLILCDVWGVVHNGAAHHPAAVDALRRFRAAGGTVVLATNAPAPAHKVQHRLDRLAVPREAYDAIATSGDVTIDLIVAAGCPPLFSIGPGGEFAIYKEASRLGPRPTALVSITDAEIAICIGPDATGEEPQDYDANLAALRDRNLEMICANPDLVVEMGDKLVWCAGAIAERYAAIGGRVTQAGKPFEAIYERALELARMARGAATPPARVLAIGDALHTDIAGARRMGFASLFVTSGIHRERLHPGQCDTADAAALSALLTEKTASPTHVAARLAW